MITYHGTGVSISSTSFKRMYFMGTHFISISNDIMSRRVSTGQVLKQPQDLGGVPTWKKILEGLRLTIPQCEGTWWLGWLSV